MATSLPVLTLAVSLVASTAPQQQTSSAPPRDNAPATTAAARAGTGIIRGRVTDRETGQPLGRVDVTLVSSVWRELAMSSQGRMTEEHALRQNQPRHAVTTADGRFEFKQIPPGTYTVGFAASRTRGTHLDQNFGESRPADPMSSGRRAPRIELREGEIRENVDVELSRAGAIDGRVVDDTGEPIANVSLSISEWDSPSSMGSGGMPRLTDDRGMFRLFGLRPGQYRICANTENYFGFSPDAGDDAQDKLIRTCYPNALSDADAQPVMVSSGEVGPIEIRLQRNRTYKITGIVIDSSGKPLLNADVSLVKISAGGRSSSSSGVSVNPGGQFTVSGVTSGEYGIHAGMARSGFFEPEDKNDREIGYVPVRVDAADVDGLVVATSKPAKVAGQVVFEGGLPEQGTQKLSIMAMPDDTGGGRMMFGPQRPATVRDDMTFELEGLFGPQHLMVMPAPRGWIVKSVKYRGDDVTDEAVEFKSSNDPRLLVLTMTNQGAMLTGRVLGGDKDSSEALIVLLPSDMSRWRPTPGMPVLAPKADGTFSIGPVRPGEYVVVAVTGLSMARLFEPSTRAEIAERIAKAGERIVLVENEKHSIDLRVTKIQ